MKTFALAGNPNCGKTTLFNALTGSTAHVGNWPGVTVDKKDGVYKSGAEKANIVDLPGIYSLSPYTPEELIARNYILDEQVDGIINIVDATNLERNLYLTTQLLEMDVPVIVALNMCDELEQLGDKIDAKALEQAIGVPVVAISALKKTGIKELMDRALAMPATRKGKSVVEATIGDRLQQVTAFYQQNNVPSPVFHAVKLLESDEIELKNAKAKQLLASVTKDGEDWEAVLADARYQYISAHFSVTKKKSAKPVLTKSDKADKVLTNRWAAIPIFLVIMYLVFRLTFAENLFYSDAWGLPGLDELELSDAGATILGFFYDGAIFSPGVIITNIFTWFLDLIGTGLGALVDVCGGAAWVNSLVCDAVWGGISAVLGFLPQILVLFLGFSILEDSGYMARVAFVLDRIFRKFGLSGRAFMPMIMGFGCSVPAMINTRTLADDKERTATVRVIPFFSCGAKLPILTAMAGAMCTYYNVGDNGVIPYLMYLIGIVAAIVCVLLMRNTTLRGETPPFVMELPTYRMPGFKNLMLHLWDKAKHFLTKAFTIIFASTVIIWVLQSFSWNWEFLLQDAQAIVSDPEAFGYVAGSDLVNSLEGVEGLVNLRTNESILGSLGMFIQPLFTPLGFGSQLGQTFGWVFAVAAITGLVAKENVIATFGALAAVVAGQYVDWEADSVAAALAMVQGTGITIPAIIAFIAFNMTTIPCFAACATAKAELKPGTFKWTVLFWLCSSYVISALIYTVGSWWWTAFIWAAVAAVAVVFIVLYNKGKLTRRAKACA